MSETKELLKLELSLTSNSIYGELEYKVEIRETSHRGKLCGSCRVDKRMLLTAREDFVHYILDRLRLDLIQARQKQDSQVPETFNIAMVRKDWLPEDWEK